VCGEMRLREPSRDESSFAYRTHGVRFRVRLEQINPDKDRRRAHRESLQLMFSIDRQTSMRDQMPSSNASLLNHDSALYDAPTVPTRASSCHGQILLRISTIRPPPSHSERGSSRIEEDGQTSQSSSHVLIDSAQIDL
jgi:hypothetical protein